MSSMTTPRRGRRWLALFSALLLLAASCGSKGPDMVAVIDGMALIENQVPPSELGVADQVATDQIGGTWKAEASPTEAADAIAAAETPDDRTDDAGGDIYLLYKSGTVWIQPLETGGSGVVYYEDNDKAYSRHSGVLIASRTWGNRVNSYRSNSSSSSSSNGFRGGGGSSGK